MISETLIIALTASVIAPSLLAAISYFTGRATKREEWRRQDEVAKKVAEVAGDLGRNAELTNHSFQELKTGQHEIHVLVNSNLTAEMQNRKESLERELVVLHELVSLKKKLGVQPSALTFPAIKVAEASLRELKSQIKERLATAKILEQDKAPNERAVK